MPEYSDGVESIRLADDGSLLPSARFVSLVVHGARQGEAPVTLMLAQWGQFIDHDLTATAQPRSINGSVPRCCGATEKHPACLTIRVPNDDPWLAPLNVRCLEFLRSAPAQRRDCVLSWREQINQATSYLDASTVYASNPRSSDSNRLFRDGLLLFGRGPPREDVCLRGALANQCIRPGDQRSGEQPGLLAMHTVWVGEHNRITLELGDLNPHWSDEKLYQETRRIVGAMIQHITYREFLPLVLGREVARLFDLELVPSGHFNGYDPKINPTVGNAFGAAAFRFGHSLIQGSLMRCDRNHRFITNNVTLHEELARGDIGGAGSLHRLLRGMLVQRALKRDEFITPELTNHLFQSSSFPFGLDLAAINIQRGRDHGLPSYTSWRVPCGLSAIHTWKDLENVAGPESTQRISQAYRSVNDVDLFVGGLAERPVIGGLVGPTFACILAQQFSNLRKGDRFWYENGGFESSFTPAQLDSIRQVTLSQVLCRSMNGGTLQPHAFLPPDIVGNDRQTCGRQSLTQLDLFPWTERDPMNKQHDLPLTASPTRQTLVAVKPQSVLIQTSEGNGGNKKKKKKKPINVPVLLAQSVGSTVDNKLDFMEVTTKRQDLKLPKLNATVSDKIDNPGTSTGVKRKRPVASFTATTVSNKLDFTRRRIQPTKKIGKTNAEGTKEATEPRHLTDEDNSKDEGKSLPEIKWQKNPNSVNVEITWNHNFDNFVNQRPKPVLNDKIATDEDNIQFITGVGGQAVQQENSVTPSPPYSYWDPNKLSSPFSYDKTTNRPFNHFEDYSPTYWASSQMTQKPFDIRTPASTPAYFPTSSYSPSSYYPQPPSSPSNLFYVSRDTFFSKLKSSFFKLASDLDILIEPKTVSDLHLPETEPSLSSSLHSESVSSSTSSPDLTKLITSTKPTDIDFDDYDITTSRPVLSEDYVETTPDQTLTQFDRDGYLRPEYMNWEGQTKTDKKDDRKLNKDFQTVSFVLKNLTGHVEPRRPVNLNIESELTDSDPTRLTDNHVDKPEEEVLAFVPLVVLTSPERPDNWIIIEGSEKAPLPLMPEINQDPAASSEVPKPMLLL